MTADPSTPSPSGWAESLLQLVLSGRDRESVSGDLLEEYRTSIVPSRGAGADRWYLRQVAGHIVRQSWMWAAVIAGMCLWRYLLDTLAPIHYTPGVIAPRSAIMTWVLVGTFAACGAWHAWRAANPIAGAFLTAVTGWTGGALAVAGTAFLLALRHDPATVSAINGSGGFGELWAIPLIQMPVVGTIVGCFGALAGYFARAAQDYWSSPNTKSA